jgi:glycosyltransferase involved in cell wall biosynthesis
MDKNMKIAIIAGGLLNIPPTKFGAIEMIIWNYKLELEKLGHEVTIFNDVNLKKVASQINNGGFDFVHLNYSEYVSFFNKHLKVPFCTTCHSGYITNKKKWSIGYYAVFYDTMKCPGIISLSPYIKDLYLESGYKGFVRVIRNGIDVKNFITKEEGNNRAICLGRIEPRKRQAWLSSIMTDKVDLDFVGPIQDEAFKVSGRCQYAGYWMKQEVYKRLSDYNCLVLLSDGEAAPLVAPEALAAGLSVVVSKSASANLDEKLPFVSILPDDISDADIIAKTINEQIKNNKLYRPQILDHAKSYFDMSAVIADYLKVIEEFKNTKHTKGNTFKIPSKEVPIYMVSKLALFIKGVLRKIRMTFKPIVPAD